MRPRCDYKYWSLEERERQKQIQFIYNNLRKRKNEKVQFSNCVFTFNWAFELGSNSVCFHVVLSISVRLVGFLGLFAFCALSGKLFSLDFYSLICLSYCLYERNNLKKPGFVRDPLVESLRLMEKHMPTAFTEPRKRAHPLQLLPKRPLLHPRQRAPLRRRLRPQPKLRSPFLPTCRM